MKNLIVLSVLALAFCAGAVEYKFEITSNKAWKLECGEEVAFSCKLLSRENAKAPFTVVKGATLQSRLVVDGVSTVVKNHTTGDNPISVSAKRMTPGWVYVRFALMDAQGKKMVQTVIKGRKSSVYGGIGALYEPEKLKAAKAEPRDFDAFWKSRRAMLNNY